MSEQKLFPCRDCGGVPTIRSNEFDDCGCLSATIIANTVMNGGGRWLKDEDLMREIRGIWQARNEKNNQFIWGHTWISRGSGLPCAEDIFCLKCGVNR